MVLTVLGIGLLAALAFVGVALLARCSNVSVTAFIWPSRVVCGTPLAAGIVRAVDEVLSRDGLSDVLSDASVTTLEDIAREYGAEKVVCSLAHLRTVYSQPSSDPSRTAEFIARAHRADAFLVDRKVEITNGPDA